MLVWYYGVPIDMPAVTVSPKYQIVIPKAVREKYSLRPGDKGEVIEWDGVYDSGEFAVPGLVYSYVLEAGDKAGNRRNFVGPGFEVAPYRIEHEGNFHMVISGESLLGPGAATRPAGTDDPWLLEAASWLNQYAAIDQPIDIHVLR